MNIHRVIALVLVLFIALSNAWGNPDRVKLSDIQVLTLRQGEYTAGRRSAPVPQLECIGGSAKQYARDIDVVQCKNMGFDGYDVQWKCDAELDSKVKFGKLDVSCEGYDYADDPFILRGSCGLQYNLELTQQGKTHQQEQHHQQNNNYQNTYQRQQAHQNTYQHTQYESHPSPDHTGSRIKSLLMFGIVIFIFYNIYKQCVHSPAHSGGNPGGFGGGGYGGGNFGPGGGPGSGPGTGPYSGDSCNPQPTAPPAASWRPGFWTGLATGGFLGNWWNRPRHYTHYATPRYSAPAFNTGPSFAAPSFASRPSSGGTSSTTRTSSGFGGTRRR